MRDMKPARVFLSRRNLETLLNKLNRPGSARTIIKRDSLHAEYPQSHDVIYVTAVEDFNYYADRMPGVVDDAPEY